MKVLLKENNQVKWVEEVKDGDPILTKRQKFKMVDTYKWSTAKSETVPENACPSRTPGSAVPGGSCSVPGNRFNTGLCIPDGSGYTTHTYYECILSQTAEPDGFELVWDKSSDSRLRLIKEGTVVGWRNIEPPLGGIEFRYRIKKHGGSFGSWQTIMVAPQNKEVYNAGNFGYENPVKLLRLYYTPPQLFIGGNNFYIHQGASSLGDQIEILLPSMPAFGLDAAGGGWDMDMSAMGLSNVTFQVLSDNFDNALYVLPYGMTLGSNGDFGGFDYIVET